MHNFTNSLLTSLFLLIFCCFLSEGMQAQQVFEEWVSIKGNQNFNVNGKAITDGSGNVYQTGATLNQNGDYDGIITKYDRHGNEIWTKQISGSSDGDETFVDIVLTGSGRLMATGVSRNSSGTSSELLTVQLNTANGSLIWSDYYTQPGSIYNVGAAIALDASSNAYITGATSNNNTLTDALIVKYSGIGNVLWSNSSDYSNGGHDAAVKVRVSGGKVSITGGTQSSVDSWKYLALTYSTSSGALIDSYISTGSGTSIDKVQDMTIDDNGNIYVTGTAGTTGEGYNMYTMKLDDELNLLWENSYNYAGSGDDKAFGICLDNFDNPIITGATAISSDNTQFTTIKYSNNGSIQWIEHLDPGDGLDSSKVVTADSNDNIYIAGTFDNGSNQDLKTVKYDQNGSLIWSIDFNGVQNGNEYLLDIAHDGESAIVNAQTEMDGAFRYIALKYNEIEYASPDYPDDLNTYPSTFIRNSGQLRSENEAAVPSVKYYSKQGQIQSFYKDDRFEFLARTYHVDSASIDTAQKIAFNFVNPNSSIRTRPIGRSKYFENYYFKYDPQNLERVPTFNRMFYHEIWRGISLEILFNRAQEYSFTIDKNGRVGDIKLNITGADSIVKYSSGELGVHTFNDVVKLGSPRAYQENGSGNLVELNWSPEYALSGNEVTLDSIGSFDAQQDVIIRFAQVLDDIPQTEGFCHSTYIGNSHVNVFDGSVDADGDPIFCGFSTNSNFYLELENSIWEGNTALPETGFITKLDKELIPQFSTFVFPQSDDGYSEITLNAISSHTIFIDVAGTIWADWAPTDNEQYFSDY